MASSKIKYNFDYCYDKADKLSCHERSDIVHNVYFKSLPSIPLEIPVQMA